MQACADDVALRLRDSLELERLSFLLDYLHRRQLIAALERRLYWSPDSALSDQVLTVGFADLTGYTSLTQQLTGPELDVLVARFESLTRDVIAEYGGRVVKTIGDEVMFLCANPIAGADLALRLVEAHTEDDILPPWFGLDCGPIPSATATRSARSEPSQPAGRPGCRRPSWCPPRCAMSSTARSAWVCTARRRRLKDIGSTWLGGWAQRAPRRPVSARRSRSRTARSRNPAPGGCAWLPRWPPARERGRGDDDEPACRRSWPPRWRWMLPKALSRCARLHVRRQRFAEVVCEVVGERMEEQSKQPVATCDSRSRSSPGC